MRDTRYLDRLQNILEDFVKIYPNPVKQYLFFQLKSPTNSTISIFDIKGALIRTVSASNNFEINVSDLPKGFYFINLKLEDKVTSARLNPADFQLFIT